MHAEWQNLASAASIVAAIDLDGTLLPFAPTPQEARLDDQTIDLIESLSNAPGVTMGIISGRPRDLVADLTRRFPRLAVAAEHGVWRFASGVWESALDPVPQLEEIERALTGLAKRFPGALLERKTCSVCLHWRRV
jgi:trehalose-phosphatase